MRPQGPSESPAAAGPPSMSRTLIVWSQKASNELLKIRSFFNSESAVPFVQVLARPPTPGGRRPRNFHSHKLSHSASLTQSRSFEPTIFKFAFSLDPPLVGPEGDSLMTQGKMIMITSARLLWPGPARTADSDGTASGARPAAARAAQMAMWPGRSVDRKNGRGGLLTGSR